MSSLRDQTAIVGVGYTPFSKNSGVTTLTLALRAIAAALEDAGLSSKDVDGLATFRVGDSVLPMVVAQSLGIRDLRFHLDQFGGGSVSHAIVGQAALALHAGVAETIVVYRALNARSGFRMGGTGRPLVDAVETQYQAPYGYFTPPQQFAMAARAHMDRYGTKPEHLGQIAVQQRAFARDNERAMMRAPMTMSDYLAARYVVEPFRLFDCCLETDGAVALVLTRAERARDLRQTPVLIRGAAWGGGQTLYSNQIEDTNRTAAADMAPRLYAMAGVGPSDFDLAELYDCFTYSVLVQLEDYGFCKKGEGGKLVEEGRTRVDGDIPINPSGGLKSFGHPIGASGVRMIYECVQQLRGACGERQVKNAELGLAHNVGGPGAVSCVVILGQRD